MRRTTAPPPLADLPTLTRQCAEWASRSQPECTLNLIVSKAREAGLVGALLAQLPLGSGITAERLERVRRRLESAGGK